MEEAESANAADDGTAEQEAYYELQCYTLAHHDPGFIHQYIVDAWAAQHATERTKPIGLAFALIGLHLHIERGFSGRQVQRMHMALGQWKRKWPSFILPRNRGSRTASWVMAASAGPERDQAIDVWCASVWDAFSDSHIAVVELLKEHGVV